jgi:hypothetical protein
MAAQQLDQAKSAFGETYERSKEQLDHAGLSPAKLGATFGSVAEGVQKTVDEVTRRDADEIHTSLGTDRPADGRAQPSSTDKETPGQT